ncbi:diacylglycerol O-acyltransferase Ecym_2398 [Eremothecium cymbalariae DBVPG|uniref:Diacylglycerol O-acyltransferase n=1 Tax=Eremothecium cymbalariae (strain CBS 270.75 / DBVPG 7215 / KCTC 17166 / NRRL Y-17582) TaxID=931890 RepID=G8JNR3_ERECY|nr:Hypothetical protein Ecym_2398 [Eremothecium cymbalariae DBVPG\
MTDGSPKLSQRTNERVGKEVSKSVHNSRKDNPVTKTVKDKCQSASEFLRKELLQLKVYDKTNPEGGQLNDTVLRMYFFGQSFNIPPLHMPIQRRLQTLIVAWHTGCFLYFLVFSLFILANPFLWWLMVPYFIYFALDRTPANGNVVKRYSHWFRSLPLWRFYCQYYPIKLYKTVDLEPTFTEASSNGKAEHGELLRFRIWPTKVTITIRRKQNRNKGMVASGPRYIFGYHPHGVVALGAFGSMATEGCGWSKVFPGIPVCVCTLVNQFQIPIYRDYLLAFGCTSVSRRNVLKVLDQNYSVGIVIGGAREALLSKVGSTELILEKRKGFVKLALETGNVNLVPIYAFGETDCYNILDTGKETYLRKFQLWVKETYGFTIPFFFARGMFNYDFGFIPFRNPINVVVGRPIYIEKKRANPTMEEIDHYHKLYISEIQKVFNENKQRFGFDDKTLRCVE